MLKRINKQSNQRPVHSIGSNSLAWGASLKSSFIVAFISGLAGLLMLMHDIVIASHFATGGAADAYQLAIIFPMLAINVFAGGTLLAVLVPLLTQYSVGGRDAEATVLLKRARRALGWFLLLVCLIWALVYPHVIAQVAEGFAAETIVLSVHLLWLLVPVLFFAGLAGVDAAVLNSRRRFIFISTLPAFMPAGAILSIFFLEERLGIYAAAIGLVLGGALQWSVCRRLAGPWLRPLVHSATPATMRPQFVRDYATVAASAALLAGILLVDTIMASVMPTGSVAAYGYAIRPVILVMALVTVAVGNVLLPVFSHMVANEDWSALKKHAIFWFGLMALGSLPLVALWHAYAVEIVALLYQRGAFDASDTVKVASVQQVYMLQVPFYLIAVIGLRVMNSLNRHTAALVISALCFIANLAADLWLAPRLGLPGIAWGTNLAYALWAILITTYLLILHVNHSATTAQHRP